MTRTLRNAIRHGLILAAAGLLSSLMPAASAAAPAARPNIVVILVDDMGWSDIGPYGSEIPTPNLDALAKNGLRFTQFYNTARCSPTRASVLTGHYPHQAGMGHLDGLVREGSLGFQGRIADTSVTIAEVLGSAGYFTCMTGKWHLGQQHGTAPWTRGFALSLNLRAGGIHFAQQGGRKGGASLYLNGEEKPLDAPEFGDDWYGTYLWTEWGLKFIDEARAAKKPFFLYLAHCAPHFPLMAPPEEIARFRGKYLKGWDQLREERYRRQVEMGLIEPKWALSERPPASPAWDTLSRQEQDRFDHMMAIYAGMISAVDKSVGMVVDGLKQRGVLDNTLLLFLSDNGGNAESGPDGRTVGEPLGGPDSTVFLGMNWATLNNTPFRRYKHFTHEGGVSTPLIAHWPMGIAPGNNRSYGSGARRRTAQGDLVDAPGHVIDIMATAVDLAGATYPKTWNGHAINPMEGVSLKPVFEGGKLARANPIFYAHEGNRGVRAGKWKLVSKYMEEWELYDMEADRTELRDLASERPDLVRELYRQWQEWAKRTHTDPWIGPPRTDWGAEIKQ